MSYQYVTGDFTPRYIPKYHNVGQLKTPYIGKHPGSGGDYGPPQQTRYYTNSNPVYPYPLDTTCNKNFGLNYNHTRHFVPPDYFAPHTRYPSKHCVKGRFLPPIH